MSKNTVDALIEFTNESNNSVGLIPSRRQVDHNGGYANNWTTKKLKDYVFNNLFLTRDHGGPGQGEKEDDGYESLEQDCKHFDMIHVDPWKRYPEYEEGLKWTVDMINFCYDLNPSIKFEVGTEESIRKFTPSELGKLLSALRSKLAKQKFNQIEYAVIQSGTSLEKNTNTGKYNRDALIKMLKITKEHGLLSKEHNGDYIPADTIKEKIRLGLDTVNIAPEFGQIETTCYLSSLEKDKDLFELFYEICYKSNRWKKWVTKDFDPLVEKRSLVNICGHYVLSNNDFLSKIKAKLPKIDLEVKAAIKNKLYELH